VKWAKRKPAVAALWVRAVGAVGVAVAGVLAGFAYEHRVKATRMKAQAAGLVRSLAEAETAAAPRIIDELEEVRNWATPLLEEAVSQSDPSSKARLHASMVLLPREATQANFLSERLLSADLPSITPLRPMLKPFAPRLEDSCWQAISDPNGDGGIRLRDACALAEWNRDDPLWPKLADRLVDPMLAAIKKNPVDIAPVTKNLAPVRDALIPSLSIAFADAKTGRVRAVHDRAHARRNGRRSPRIACESAA
jgi:hypothetical protein